jgi:hypothetical protein
LILVSALRGGRGKLRRGRPRKVDAGVSHRRRVVNPRHLCM